MSLSFTSHNWVKIASNAGTLTGLYYGLVRWHHSLQKLVLEGKVDGKRGRGRRRKSWTGNMSEMTKMSMAQCSVKALDRSEWCTMVSNLYAETEP